MTYRVSFNAIAYIDIEASSEAEALELAEKVDWHEPIVEIEPHPSMAIALEEEKEVL